MQTSFIKYFINHLYAHTVIEAWKSVFFVTLLKHYVIVHENTNIVIPIFTLYEIRESLYALLNEASLKRHFFFSYVCEHKRNAYNRA